MLVNPSIRALDLEVRGEQYRTDARRRKFVYVLIGTPPPPEQTGSTFQRGSLAEDGMDAGGSQSHGDDLLGGVVAAQDDYAATPVEPTARPHYFDGKFLVDRDLMREQASSSGASENRSAPSVSEVVVTKQNDSAHETPFYLHLRSIDIEATASPTSGDDILIGGATNHDGGINLMLGDGSVRNVRSDTAGPFFAYDQGFLGGVTVAADDSVQRWTRSFLKGDRRTLKSKPSAASRSRSPTSKARAPHAHDRRLHVLTPGASGPAPMACDPHHPREP